MIIKEILDYESHLIHPRLSYFKPHTNKTQQTFAQEISFSLNSATKSINPKFFYDEKGSILFDSICKLPEYYLTRAEIKILNHISDDLASFFTNDICLVELGSGSSLKTRLILDILEKVQDKIEYIPIDVSDILKKGCEQLLSDYKKLHVTGIIDTYNAGLKFIKNFHVASHLIIFLGSSFGNFSSNEGNNFLKHINSLMNDSDLFLIGIDLVKEKHIIENAYNDSQGITAKFNLNVLSRINNELDGNFDLEKFSHHILYNEKMQRIEMYLKSVTNQTVKILKSNLEIDFFENELICTEYSHKYTISQIEKMFVDTGFTIKKIWQDDKKHYALVLSSKTKHPERT